MAFDDRSLKQKTIRNIGWHRLEMLDGLGYPIGDRPRGDRDVASVRYHVECYYKRIPIAPCIVYVVGGVSIMLDGMHRFVAAVICDDMDHEAVTDFIVYHC